MFAHTILRPNFPLEHTFNWMTNVLWIWHTSIHIHLYSSHLYTSNVRNSWQFKVIHAYDIKQLWHKLPKFHKMAIFSSYGFYWNSFVKLEDQHSYVLCLRNRPNISYNFTVIGFIKNEWCISNKRRIYISLFSWFLY